MRIVTHTIEEFLANIDSHRVPRVSDRIPGIDIHNEIVYFSRTDRPANGTPRDATHFNVVVQASAVLQFVDGGQALLECGIDCGDRIVAGDGHDEGGEEAGRLREIVVAYCEEHKYRLLPGIVNL